MKILRLLPNEDLDRNPRVLVIPHTEQPKRFGTVHMVGEGVNGLKEGDKIAYGEYSGTDLAIPGDRIYLIMRLSDIYAIVEF